MIFRKTAIEGVEIIEAERLSDERGFFARTWCADEFRKRGLNPHVEQCSVSYNARAHTLRGMHYQVAPFAEAKTVRCTRGAIFDVAVDLRPESPTYRRWVAETLTEDNHVALYIPEGFAHGFLTLAPQSEVFYQMSVAYKPDCARAFHWADPAIGIVWPREPEVISARDAALPAFAG